MLIVDAQSSHFPTQHTNKNNILMIQPNQNVFDSTVVGNEHQMRKLRGGQRLVHAGETRGRITLGEAGESFYGDSLKGSLCFFSLLC